MKTEKAIEILTSHYDLITANIQKQTELSAAIETILHKLKYPPIHIDTISLKCVDCSTKFNMKSNGICYHFREEDVSVSKGGKKGTEVKCPECGGIKVKML